MDGYLGGKMASDTTEKAPRVRLYWIDWLRTQSVWNVVCGHVWWTVQVGVSPVGCVVLFIMIMNVFLRMAMKINDCDLSKPYSYIIWKDMVYVDEIAHNRSGTQPFICLQQILKERRSFLISLTALYTRVILYMQSG